MEDTINKENNQDSTPQTDSPNGNAQQADETEAKRVEASIVDDAEDVMAEPNAEVEESELDVALIREMLDKYRSESQSNLEGWQRSRAEFNNYRKRTQQQLADSKQKGALDALAKVLPVLDDFERAFDNIPADLADNPWVSGTSLILKNLQKVMDDYNIETLDPVGEEFNPNYHEAIGMDDSTDYESGIVTTTLQKGYKSGDTVLRPALVRVAS
ncbi:MAG: nucleotide exchange factor GrpE [Chloroflexota bacterium]